MGDANIAISEWMVTISTKAGSWTYSKSTQSENNKLLEQTALKIKEFSEQYRLVQKQKMEDAHKKLIEDIENF